MELQVKADRLNDDLANLSHNLDRYFGNAIPFWYTGLFMATTFEMVQQFMECLHFCQSLPPMERNQVPYVPKSDAQLIAHSKELLLQLVGSYQW